MKGQYRVVVIGGGIVGVNVLYHLARKGWTDIALIERSELTAGSTWHAAAGFHAINDDPNIAALQAYTIGLYKTVEAESGQNVGLHMPGGYSLATTPERWEFLQSEIEVYATLGIEARLASAEEIVSECPIVDPDGLLGGLFDPHEGAVDPHGATHAFALAARKLGADVIVRNRVIGLQWSGDAWHVETEHGTIIAEHVVNAAGLWARRVGHMVGVDHPITTMQHHYLITEDLPVLLARRDEMPCVTDLEGFTYLQQERKGVILGVYERNPKHWRADGAAWDYGMELLPEDIDRISPELLIGFRRFPTLEQTGIRKWVSGAFSCTPDGNPLVGPVPGVRNYWAACGCLAGFSQGGAVGKVLADWMVDGSPDGDLFGMDVARYGKFASGERYLRETTAQFYARRFLIAYPNEELPAGRPLHVTPAYAAQRALGARFGVVWGTESPQYFATGEPEFVDTPTLRRPPCDRFVAAEVAATRNAAGLLDTAVYARYEVRGPGATAWLDGLVASRLPAVGRVKLAPMLNASGHLMGDLSLTRLEEDRYWIVGSYYLQEWHQRWFRQHLPERGVELENLSQSWLGFSLAGPQSRNILAALTHGDVSSRALPFMTAATFDLGFARALVVRIGLTGELGYEIYVPAAAQLELWQALLRVGGPLGLRPTGMRAQDSLRLEKGYGVWSLEFSPACTPAETGLDRFIAPDKGDFIGRKAFLASRASPPSRRLVLLAIDSPEADATGYEPIRHDGRRVGYVTSGAYGHTVGTSLALGFVESALASSRDPLTVSIVGKPCRARILPAPLYDPTGAKLRS